MSSIRRRLTVWYAVALLASVGAFGGALYFERRRSSVRELDERLSLEGNLAAQYYIGYQQKLGRLLAPGETPGLGFSAVGGYLDGIRDLVVVFDPDQVPIYRNANDHPGNPHQPGHPAATTAAAAGFRQRQPAARAG